MNTPHRHSAQSLVEFAFILPVLMLLLLGLIEIGRAFVFGIAVQAGAHEAARLAANARVDPSISDTAIVQRVLDASAPALSGCSVAVPVSMPASMASCGGGTWTISMRITPGPGGSGGVYSSFAQARASSDAAYLNGATVQVSASAPSVALLSGIQIVWSGMALYQIPVQGSATMVVL